MVPAAEAEFPDAWLAQYLVDGGLVTSLQLDGLDPQVHSRLWDAVVNSGLASDDAIIAMLSDRFKVPVADLASAQATIGELLPAATARKHLILPLTASERIITVATADPRNYSAEQELEWVTGRSVQFRLAPPSIIAEQLDEVYEPENVINRLLEGMAPAPVVSVDASPDEANRDPALDAPMTRLVDAILSDAVLAGASDIHTEVEGREVVIRYRVDGILREIMRIPASAGPSLVRRVKIVAGLDVTNAMTPQDGRSTVKVGEMQVDLRVATAPVARHGEKLVVRILNKDHLKHSISALDLSDEDEEVLRRMISHREGVVLVTGPTGSGKTTTLYAILNHLRTGKVNIVTVEDPVEYDIDGISQLQVNEAQGFTFAKALRSVLRQDPDIVLVGEIRDIETATIAMQAGLTGHLVFSTLHTIDALAAAVRLRDMGVESFKIGSTVRGLIAQRLLRRLCTACAEPVPIAELPVGARPPDGYGGDLAPQRPVGCPACDGSGYRGRMAVMELVPVEGELRRLIEIGATRAQLDRAAEEAGVRSLRRSGLRLFWQGDTSLDEIDRVVGEAAPATAGATPTTDTPPPADTPAGPRTILLADDDPAMRRLLRAVLEREGFVIVEAGDGTEALAAIATHDFKLVVLDNDMPEVSGIGVLEKMRSDDDTAEIPVIMLTAGRGVSELKALELGAHDFLTKPVQPRSLVARIQAVLRRTAQG